MKLEDIEEVKFVKPNPNDESTYYLFHENHESDSNVFFHGTSEDRAELIVTEGFKPAKTLTDEGYELPELDGASSLIPKDPLYSINFAEKSIFSLEHACMKKGNGHRGVVFAVEFKTLDDYDCVKEESTGYLYVYEKCLPPEIIIKYYYVPLDYSNI